MVSIRGPKSALTDFIEEHGIRVKNVKKPAESAPSAPKRRRRKNVYVSKPVEIGNIECEEEDALMREVLNDPYSYDLSDEQLQSFAGYLSRNRMMDRYFFEYIVKKAVRSLVVYDCSMIPDESFKMINGNLSRLELHFCGQLSSNTLSTILRDAASMEILRITGAYTIDAMDFPRRLRVIDLSHCSRLENSVIDRINDVFASLEELRLSFCYGLDEKCKLKTRVKKLYLCETRVSTDFLAEMKDLEDVEELSLKRCVNMDGIDEVNFTRIRKLDVEGITSISSLKLPDTVDDLNISYCYNIKDFCYPNLRFLNLSYLDLAEEELLKICKLRKLECLNMSWCRNVDDALMAKLSVLESINTIYVFGCFGLSSVTADLAWRCKDRVRVIGNPYETHFLLHR